MTSIPDPAITDLAITDRRAFLGTLGAIPLLALPGCASLGDLGGGLGLGDAVRRLLTLSSQRAFARLLVPGGFFEDQLVRIDVPQQLGGSGTTSILSALLRTGPVRDRLLRQVNRAAEEAADAAAPVVYDSIRSLSLADAVSIVRGGPSAATDVLQSAVGSTVASRLLPDVGGALRLFDSTVVTQALHAATGIDFAGLADDVSRKTGDAIFRAIGREEAAIRANPRATGDPLLIGVFGLLR